MRVLIAGAGIGGLTSALALARVGVETTLIERAETLAEAGAGLQLSPNATRILARLGLLDTVAATATRPSGVRVRSARSGRTLSFMPLDTAEARWGAPYLVTRRADLQRALADAVAAEPAVALDLGTALAGFGMAKGRVVAAVARGLVKRSIEADALIGADGIRSAVRARLVGEGTGDAGLDAPQELGRTAWRALVPADAAPEALRNAETGLWLGRDAHLVHYAVAGGSLVNIVAVTRDTTEAAPDLWSQPGDAAVIGKRLAGWHRSARALIEAAPSWTTWPIYDRKPLPAWNAGLIALLGDAAHPILPFFAQGAAQAIEDAQALADAIAATRDVSAALAAYSAARLARATRVQEASRELGRIYHLAGPAGAARNLAMRFAGPRQLLARYDWVYRPSAP